MRIGLDLDGVVANWVGSVIENLNRYQRTKLDPDFQPPSWDWFKENLTKDQWNWMWRGGCQGIFESIHPYPGAIKFVDDLAHLGDIIVMTSRPKIVWDTTRRWWNQHFEPTTPAGFNFFYSGQAKHHVQVDVLIEDNPDYAEEYGQWDKNGDARVFLLDRAWNAGYNSYIVERMPNYEAIIIELERLKNEESE
jgi:5'(3')-deoxyribonucleotidase